MSSPGRVFELQYDFKRIVSLKSSSTSSQESILLDFLMIHTKIKYDLGEWWLIRFVQDPIWSLARSEVGEFDEQSELMSWLSETLLLFSVTQKTLSALLSIPVALLGRFFSAFRTLIGHPIDFCFFQRPSLPQLDGTSGRSAREAWGRG
jgi:hypothetical protein